MKPTFTYATQKEAGWLSKKDDHIDLGKLKKKISDQEVIFAKVGSEVVGWLRFGFFWDEIPFMNMLFIEEAYRSKGIGKNLVQFWEEEMIKKRHKLLMTSSLSNEEAQHFYRKIGYSDSGSFTLPNEPEELIFVKELK